MLHGKANQSLENAKDIKLEVDNAIDHFNDAKSELKKVRNLSNRILTELKSLHQFYITFIEKMEETVQRTTNYKEFRVDEKYCLEKTILSLKLLKHLSMQNILDSENENRVLSEEVNHVLTSTEATRKEKLVMYHSS